MPRKKKNDIVPSYDKLLMPTLKALKELGGSGSIEEINEQVYEIIELSEDILQMPHDDNGVQTEIEYRLAWARTYLKKYGLINNSSRGIWAIIDAEIDIKNLTSNEIVRAVRASSKKKLSENKPLKDHKKVENEIEEDLEEEIEWKEELLDVLQNIDPSAFERLCQRLLRESGFTQVEVTGKVGDGGIDGKGIVRISGFLSFHVIFQCKRYKGSITSSQIRDFRGAMQGRADKGLFITTGVFTRDAIKEATRDGAPPIDLIEGELLCEKLKEFGLGVKTELIEKITITEDWFKKI
ncbi:MAG: restriction endonuclease [Chitinophagales bacterium]